MTKVIIDLEFDEKPTKADVINYLNELIHNDCLSYSEITLRNPEEYDYFLEQMRCIHELGKY